MPDIQEGPSPTAKDNAEVDHVPSDFIQLSDQARVWVKGHRTFIASSTSSVLSTLTAVCMIGSCSRNRLLNVKSSP